MNELPAALSAMGQFPQFIVYLKSDKFPCDYRTGKVVSAHQPEYWTDHTTAIASAAKLGEVYGVGFVFTEQDPFWFLDLDNCLQADNTWSPMAIECCTLLAGCAVEVSQSGKGLHLFGTGKLPPHAAKMQGVGELYDSKRFVALTGSGIIGDSGFPGPIQQIAAKYFPPHGGEASTDWTDSPCAEWRGSQDDNELIRRACNSRSAAGAFGSRATFQQLWDNDAVALASIYPDSNPERAYDYSSADAALAQHLAFWTGKNCERIHALMMRSGLVRDKYNREDYLERTILKAVGQQIDVCCDKEKVAVIDGVFLSPEQQKELFAGCVYVEDTHRVLVPGGSLLKPEQFKVRYGGYMFAMDTANIKLTKDAWEAFTISQVNKCTRVDSCNFKPNKPFGHIEEVEGRKFVNKFVPIQVYRKRGDISPFLNHLAKVLPDERDRAILLNYMAACVQHQGVKFDWAPLIQGVEGNGKTLFTYCVQHAIGMRYTHIPRADEISEKFNTWLFDNIFIGVNDVFIPNQKRELFEILKPMITDKRLAKRAMHADQVMVDVVANFIFNCNPKDGMLKTRNDRRICPLFCAQQSREDIVRDGMHGDYFPKLYNWLKADGYAMVSEYLHTFKIDDDLNPAVNCHRAPDTTSTRMAIEASTGRVEQEILEAVAQGRQGFCGQWISSIMLGRLLDDLGVGRGVSHARRKDILEDMGYIYHPGLHDGRVNNQVLPDQSKPRLFVHKESAARYITGAAEIARSYETANNQIFSRVPV